MTLDADNTSEQFVPKGNQGKIFEYLNQIKSKFQLGQIYYGALQAYKNNQLHVRHSFAAHGFRELIEKLAMSLSSNSIIIQDVYNQLKVPSQQFLKLTSSEDPEHCLECKKWLQGKNSTSFLESIRSFFDWYHTRPKKRDIYKEVLISSDPLKIKLPKVILDSFSISLSTLYRYFTNVSHHTITDFTDFDGRIATLESILLNLFYPPTFPKHDVIDQIINEAEGNDH